MNSIRKWLYRPKKTDQSLLAQFFYADEDLNTVAGELDSFDGRKDPDRCTALVNHLRQCQDKVLNICQMIMEEVIPEDRAPRDFRAKFPDDVLQENLAGQLWFGAECLAAGSSILNRELESASMRPLAKALTKSLENVRNLLREQCFRNPPEFTEKICESLKILDRLFAEFELSYVSAMVPVKTVNEYEAQQGITVLFSETLQRALDLGLLHQDQVDSCDPALMFTIPRLAIIAGLVIFPDGPLCLDRGELSDMFRPFRTLLLKIRELLWTLSRAELCSLERALCSAEEPFIPTVSETPVVLEKPPEPERRNEVGQHAIHDYLDQLYKDYPHCKEFITGLCGDSPTFSTTERTDQVPASSVGEEKRLHPPIVTEDCDSEVVKKAVAALGSPHGSLLVEPKSENSGLNTTGEPKVEKEGKRKREETRLNKEEPTKNLLRPPTNFQQENSSCSESCCNSECSASIGGESNCETSSFDSECQDDIEIALAMQAAEIATRNEARSRFKNSADLIHRLFICISGVADQLQTNYAADLRSTLKCVFAINATAMEETPSLCTEREGSTSSGLEVTPDISLDEEAVEYTEEVLHTSLGQLQIESSHHVGEVISPPTWVPDQLAPQCMACTASFTVVRRRHHCRNCGKVFCGKCSGNSVPLPRYGHLKPVRVCNKCFMYSVTPFTLPTPTES